MLVDMLNRLKIFLTEIPMISMFFRYQSDTEFQKQNPEFKPEMAIFQGTIPDIYEIPNEVVPSIENVPNLIISENKERKDNKMSNGRVEDDDPILDIPHDDDMEDDDDEEVKEENEDPPTTSKKIN